MSVDVEKVLRENIDRTVHMSLATTVENRPWVCELHFAYDEDLNLYFRSLESRRHSEEIEINKLVAGSIVGNHPVEQKTVLGIYFEGDAGKITSKSQVNLAATCIAKRLRMNKNEIIKEAEDNKGHKFYKIRVKNWYIFGNFEDGSVGNAKYNIEWRT